MDRVQVVYLVLQLRELVLLSAVLTLQPEHSPCAGCVCAAVQPQQMVHLQQELDPSAQKCSKMHTSGPSDMPVR